METFNIMKPLEIPIMENHDVIGNQTSLAQNSFNEIYSFHTVFA